MSTWAFQNLDDAVQAFAFYPDNILRMLGLTTLTACFLHGDVFHLLGNLYFLWVFGDNVEIALGRVRFAVLLMGGAVLGCLVHAIFDPQSSVPLIGASCAISGVMVYYALSFPQARIAMLVGGWWRPVSMPAIGYIGFWVVLQLVGVFEQVHGLTQVSALGHIGGAVAGLLMWFYWSGQWGKLLCGQPT